MTRDKPESAARNLDRDATGELESSKLANMFQSKQPNVGGCAARLALALLASVVAAGCSAPEAEVWLFETAPIETTLGSADLRETHEVWHELIAGAEESLEFAHFYASDRGGSRLGPIVEAVEGAAARGVRVRFLAEERFYKTYPETLDRLAGHAGIDVRRLDLSELSGGVLHAKYMVVDGKRLCLGSANFDWRSLEHIQELGVVVDDAVVARSVLDVFEFDWAMAGGETVSTPAAPVEASFPRALAMRGGDAVRVTPVFSPKGLLPDESAWDLPQLVSWIETAEKSLRLQLLTFRMTGRDGELFEEVDTALRDAASRGVEVQLLVADWGKRAGTIEGLQALTRLPSVEVRMATVPAAREGHIPFARVIHSKFLVVDDERAWIGSSNWERGYFYESRNVGLLLEGRAMGAQLAAYFERTWESDYAYPVEAGARYEAPRVGE